MGDLNSLAESIKRHGLLHPVVITSDRILVAGHRRLEAAKLLGWQAIPATIIDVADLLSAERDENEVRKDFTPTEAVAIGRMIEDQERPKAEANRHGARFGHKHDGESESDSPQKINLAITASKAVGMGKTSYLEARQVVEAAESDPEKFGDLPGQMDESNNVHGAHKEMKRRMGGAAPAKIVSKLGRKGIRHDKEAPYEPKTEGQRIKAESQKSKLVNSLSIITGHCRGLEELDVQMALSVCSDEEIKVWRKRASDIAKTFRELSRKLQRGSINGNAEQFEAGENAGRHAGDSSACAA
jgi:ParB family chromosome partitioning protein